jgi:hypothetical protein
MVILLCILAVIGCTWVPLDPNATDVQVAPNQDAVLDCKRVGEVSARTRNSVGIFSRSSKKVSEELENLARNDAVQLGANTILAEGTPSNEGTQRFSAYRCPQR